ncbi:MAG: type II toxin-antitoxin system RelE/ParE family toxin [Proteobacteria bacterium]|jgi:mRNA interferase RelE/StbE|nr:type II toxin-antitoxin system RelE/ParE family toxin [Pseudomonadota bacterium]
MTYSLTFLKSAKREWDKLPPSIKQQFKNKLAKCLENPLREKDKLYGMDDCYKIKLRAAGYRLVYKVYKDRLVVQVVAVGKRDKSFVYKQAMTRM